MIPPSSVASVMNNPTALPPASLNGRSSEVLESVICRALEQRDEVMLQVVSGEIHTYIHTYVRTYVHTIAETDVGYPFETYYLDSDLEPFRIVANYFKQL